MHLTRLTLSTIRHHNVWLIWLLASMVVPAVFPYVTPHEQDPTLLEPARAQAAWGMLGLTALTWGLFQGAGFGEALARHGLGEYFSSQGVSRFSQLRQVWLACLTSLLPVLAVALVICLVWAMPGDKIEARSWVMVNFQFATLFLLAFASLQVLAIALATRIGLAGGFIAVLGLALYGLYGVGFLKDQFGVQENPALEMIWTFSPHYHLADLTQRLVFKSGHIPAGGFLEIAAYLLGLLGVHLTAALLLFKPRRN